MKKKGKEYNLYFIFKLILGLSIILFIIYKIDLYEIYLTMNKFQILYLIPLFLLYLSMHFISAINIGLLLKPSGVKVSILKLFRYTLISFGLGQISPGRIGEFGLLFFLKKERISYGVSSAAILMDRIITAGLLALMAIIGFPLFFDTKQSIRLSLFVVLVVFAGLTIVFSKSIREFIKLFIPTRFENKFTGFSKVLTSYFSKYKRETILNTLFTIPKIMISALILYVIFLALGVNINFFFVLIIYVISAIISFIPVTVGGLGVKEGISIVLFVQIGVDIVTAGSAMLLWLFFRYVEVLLTFIFLMNKSDWKRLATIKNIIKSNNKEELIK